MQWHLSCSGVSSKKITDNPVSQTVNSKAILSALHTHHPLTKQSPFWRQLWQIWFGKVWNKNEHHCSSSFRPRWEDGAALCAIWSMLGCKWIKKDPSIVPSFCSHQALLQSIEMFQKSSSLAQACVNSKSFLSNWPLTLAKYFSFHWELLWRLQKANVEFKAVQMLFFVIYRVDQGHLNLI